MNYLPNGILDRKDIYAQLIAKIKQGFLAMTCAPLSRMLNVTRLQWRARQR
jgi:hypothetical protein